MMSTRYGYLKNYNYEVDLSRYFFLLSPLKMCGIINVNLSNMVYELQKGYQNGKAHSLYNMVP